MFTKTIPGNSFNNQSIVLISFFNLHSWTTSEILNLKAEIAFVYLGDDLDVILESHERGARYARLCRDFLVEGVADHSIQVIPV